MLITINNDGFNYKNKQTKIKYNNSNPTIITITAPRAVVEWEVLAAVLLPLVLRCVNKRPNWDKRPMPP